MPTLEWIGKDKVVNHHKEVPFRVLEEKYTYNAEKSENMIIRGDNLEVLKALLPQYEGRIKCIYIDPPYNTGNEKWVYNDNVNDPQIKKWLGEVVGKEGEDLSRHDKWLCMMYPRLRLLHKLLADDGVIFISIDDNEQANLKLICDEIFGISNYLTSFHWRRTESQNNGTKTVSIVGEYIVCYLKKKTINSSFNKISLLPTALGEYRYSDEYGKFRRGTIVDNTRGNYMIDIVSPQGVKKTIRSIRTKDFIEEAQKNNMIYWTSTGTPYLKIYLEKSEGQVPNNWIQDVGVNEDATDTINAMKLNFTFSKPFSLIERLVSLCCDKNSIILDSFAGSGTTAHAVLNLNKADGGNRKFILVEMMDYAETITSKRIKCVIDGYTVDKKEIIYYKVVTTKNLANGAAILQEAKTTAENAKDKYTKVNNPKMVDGRLQVIAEQKGFEVVEGTGGNFTFYELGEMLLLPNGNLNENVGIEKIREYVYYMETKEAISADINVNDRYFMGIYRDTAYYFYYERDTATTLSVEFLPQIKHKADGYIIYADMCAVSDEELK